MNMKKKALAVFGIAAVSALVLSGCSASDGGSDNAATGEPIVVASVFDGNFFPEAPPAAQAVFDEYNAAGGFNGRPIQLDTYDEKTDPATSATATKDALDSGIVAFVGSSSLFNCAVNNQTWSDNNIISIQGTGVDPFCFSTPNVAAANTGPFFDTTASLYNGSEVLGYKAICALIVPDDAVGKAAYEQAIANWSEATGKKLAFSDFSLTRGQTSYAANVAALKSANCDAVFVNEVGAADAAVLAEMTNQGIVLPALLLTSAYSDNFAQSVNYGAQISLPAEFAPYTDPNDKNCTEWRALMEAKGIPATSFAQGGYLAAQYFIAILESIKGDVTRDSVTEAAKAMTEAYAGTGAGMVGTPWTFGPDKSHQPNAASWLVHIEPNTQEFVSDGPWLLGTEMGWKNTTIAG
ncbi:ABC transporter substrate-binding protein [Aurantimicrobium minutum]|uniref:ABC transporter substrate-binding protein n=1 Tax=Aurantimicrobium minutum TaxID=708131 RepID=UPI0024769F82|nr:ABC transporter substrate-binding protein [Aurantimicrobium minutum]MDH6536119.1 branched-chain amino acid transport system substrate-binding protein [Aurantimicrobium minutum]